MNIHVPTCFPYPGRGIGNLLCAQPKLLACNLMREGAPSSFTFPRHFNWYGPHVIPYSTSWLGRLGNYGFNLPVTPYGNQPLQCFQNILPPYGHHLPIPTSVTPMHLDDISGMAWGLSDPTLPQFYIRPGVACSLFSIKCSPGTNMHSSLMTCRSAFIPDFVLVSATTLLDTLQRQGLISQQVAVHYLQLRSD